MKVCKKCGAENADENLFCEQCGQQITGTDSSVDLSAMKETFSDVAGKTISGAKNLAGQINSAVSTTLENQKQKSQEEVQQEIERAQEKKTVKRVNMATGTEYMSSTELWSWLQKDSKRQHFFTEEVNTLSVSEYMQKLAEKLEENKVPASVNSREIQWDRSNVKQHLCFVQPHSEAVNPLSCLVQFNHIGKFTFVEEKTFITPPDLPEVPQKPVDIPADLASRALGLLWGGAMAIFGLGALTMFDFEFFKVIGVFLVLAGLAWGWFGFSARQKLLALQAHNQKCIQQEIAWNAAWSNWQNSIFLHSFQESVNGQVSRIYDAVFECIQQLNKELFSDQTSDTQSESQSMNELEQLIARRKDDYR